MNEKKTLIFHQYRNANKTLFKQQTTILLPIHLLKQQPVFISSIATPLAVSLCSI
jgi:hypothetical protein